LVQRCAPTVRVADIEPGLTCPPHELQAVEHFRQSDCVDDDRLTLDACRSTTAGNHVERVELRLRAAAAAREKHQKRQADNPHHGFTGHLRRRTKTSIPLTLAARRKLRRLIQSGYAKAKRRRRSSSQSTIE